jgi:WD40 repeat protein
MAFGMQAGGIAFCDLPDRAYKLEHKHTGPVTSVAFSPDSQKLASASVDGTVLVWDAPSRELIAAPIRHHARRVMSVAFSPDGKTLASGGTEGKVFLHDAAGQVRNGELLAGHKGWVRAVQFSPDGKILASGGSDRKVIFWDLSTKQEEVDLQHTSRVLCLAFSPDGKILASGTREGKLILWDVASRQQLGTLKHRGKVRSVAFSPDGKTLASGSDDKTVMLWDVTTGLALGQLMTEGQQEVWSVAFSPDGNTLASGSSELMFWDVSFEEMRVRAALLAARNLTEEERKQFLRNEPYDFTSLEAELLKAHQLALIGDTAKAEGAFKALVPRVIETRSHTLNNRVGWLGSLDGFANVVLPACDVAVELVSARKEPYYRRIEAIVRDTRGVARALAGDMSGAIKDFEAVTQWADQKHKEEKTIPEEWIRPRREWLPDLKAGRNPFDSAVRRTLLRDG